MSFKDEIASQIDAANKREAGHYRGQDWFHLTEAEEAVFAIDRKRFPAMVVAWSAYESFLKLVDETGFDARAVEAERKRRTDLVKKGMSADGFQHFCKEFTDLTFREADAMFEKHQFWLIRNGITRYSDEV